MPPRTVGPNLLELTVRERAAEAYAQKSKTARNTAERAARALALSIFGNDVEIVFDDFVPESYARQQRYEAKHLVTFDVEGIEFNYSAATKDDKRDLLTVIDRCPFCEDGVRILWRVREIADIGQLYAVADPEFPDRKCALCKKKDEA